MINKETILNSVDNTGALTVKCFHIYKKKFADIGTLLIVSVKTFRAGKKVKKGEIYKAILLNTKYKFKRKSGINLSFSANNVILWKRKEEAPLGSRLKTFVPFELRFKGYVKIISISLGII